MIKKGIFSLITLLLLVFVFEPSKSYSESNSENLINGLSYELIYPDNQTNKTLGYFDIKVDKGESQKLSLKLYNSFTKDITVQVRFNTAKTNDIGNIEYGPSNLEPDKSLAINFSDIVKSVEKVVVPAKGSKQVVLTISLPDTTFNGVIAGGIQLQPVEDSIIENEKKKDIVVNEFAYLVGLIIRDGESNKIKPELKLNRTYIGFKEGVNNLLVNISNTKPVYVEGMTINVNVKKRNKREDLFNYKQEDLRMAPNSVIDFPVTILDKGLTAGDYTAQITVSEKSGSNWSWTQDFKISKMEESNFGNELSNTRTDTKKLLLNTLFIFSFFFVLVIIYLHRKK